MDLTNSGVSLLFDSRLGNTSPATHLNTGTAPFSRRLGFTLYRGHEGIRDGFRDCRWRPA